MSTELYRVRRRRKRRGDQDPAVHRRPDTHDAPGETDADPVSEAFIRGSNPAPSSVVSALYRADDGTRERMLYRMQNDVGNQYVQRVAAQAMGPAGAKGALGGTTAGMVSGTTSATGGVAGWLGEAADLLRTGEDRMRNLLNPLAQIFITVVQTNIASASPIDVPKEWQAKLVEYMKDEPADGALLLPGVLRSPQYYRGGWILDLQTDAEAMTLDHSIFVRGELSIETYVHEMVHVGQYLAGPSAFLVSYFGLSAATIAKRFVMREPLEYMRSSPHENIAYELEQRFKAWLGKHPL
ncbi:MAG: hypothetical protein HZB53_02135 [Chloroflexi bacterium]|nr:hypothetical protein [Chloroflexota bacterium]